MGPSKHPSVAPSAESELVLKRLSRIAAESSDKVAVRCGDASITYAELVARTDSLAAHLKATGVGVGDLVGIGMDRSLDLVIAVVGVWKAGAAFVPLDPDYPELRLAQMVEDAAPRALITDRNNQERIVHPHAASVLFDDVAPGARVSGTAAPIVAHTRAYVLFTSGSTGRPKGVQISHGALANFMAGIQQTLRLGPSDALAAITTLSFDISILEITLPLLQGATVVVLDRQVSGDGRQLAAALEAYACTYLQATPITWRLLVDAGWDGKEDLTIVCGGETLPRPLAEELLRRGRRVFNVYGPTEATIWATIEPVQSDEGPVPIGRTLPNYQEYLLDHDLRPAVPGDIGQLYLGGASLATGYVNRPQDTARCFITHPDLGRLYATGDLVRKRADGAMEFVGRADDQVKIRGFRVELGDIETHLLELPGVADAVVMLREDIPGLKKLVAYLIPDGSAELVPGQLRGTLTTRLPSHMIPHHYVELASFPQTPNNKVDRQRLPAPQARSATVPAPVRDPLEAYLQSVWIEVLGTEGIGANDDFFDLGGDSIQAARVTNRVEEWLGELLWPVVLFDAPTIAELGDYLRQSYPDAVSARTSAARPVPTTGGVDRVIDETLVAGFDGLLESVAPSPAPQARNPPAIFLLCPPRSGSTLLRVMLAGSPDLFAPPEIELLTFNTMRERTLVFSGRESYRLEGAIRAVVEIKGCDVDEARAILAGYEKSGTTIPEFYGILQSWLGNRRLVDKTPANCLDLEALRRIERYFEEPLYVHLTRHPLGMVRSFVEARLSAVFFRRVSHGFSPRELAELIWLTCHRNALSVLASVPAERQFTLAFETLTRAPRDTMQRLCDCLHIELHPEMLEPWRNKGKKMTDGLHTESKMMGDPKFHRYDRIDPTVADRWLEEMRDATLGAPTRALARELGYPDPGADRVAEEREEFTL